MAKDDITLHTEAETGKTKQATAVERVTPFAAEYGATDLPKDDAETFLGDLVADLMHYCEAKGLDFDQVLGHAELHYSHETDAVPA